MAIFGSGDITEEIVGIYPMWDPDSSDDLRMLGEVFRCGLFSFGSSSTKNTSETIEFIETMEAIFKNQN